MLRLLFCISLLASMASAQTFTVENYGFSPAVQAANGFGLNVTPADFTNDWVYAAIQSIGGTRMRGECGWHDVESIGTGNVHGAYNFPSYCQSQVTLAAAHGLHITMTGDYEPPNTRIAQATASAAVSVGATTIPITITSGSMASFVAGQTGVDENTDQKITVTYLQAGTVITAYSGGVLTLAEPTNIAIASGQALDIRLVLYPPFLGAGSSFNTDPAVVGAVNFFRYLGSQLRAGDQVGIFNEPTFLAVSCWTQGNICYDPNLTGNYVCGNACEIAMALANTSPLTNGATFDSAYSQIGGITIMQYFQYLTSVTNAQATVVSQSYHPYGNVPEVIAWFPECVATRLTTLASILSIFADCSPAGTSIGSTPKVIAAYNQVGRAYGGLRADITETGLTLNDGYSSSGQMTTAKFNVRQFINAQTLGISPYIAYAATDTGQGYDWFNSSTQAPYQTAVAFGALMADINAIALPPVAPFGYCQMPTITTTATPTYPYAENVLVGAKAGNLANSLLVGIYQRSYCITGTGCDGNNFPTITPPAAVSTSVSIPAGYMVNYVKDRTTTLPVAYTVSGSVVTFPVADSLIQIDFEPSSPATAPALACS